jgi:HD-GYP domain-containing protein (c-di-GMP phosphodiesterase class II)
MNVKKITAIAARFGKEDPATARHCRRVAELSLELGRACSLSADNLRILKAAAAMHDVGKLRIPGTVFRKVAPLNEHDWAIMKTHPLESQRIIEETDLEDGDVIGLIARHHHERFDGTGYPDKLGGDAIPIMARIIALADTYDAMAHQRMYRQACSHDYIMRTLYDEQGRQHDGYLYQKLTKITESWGFAASA